MVGFLVMNVTPQFVKSPSFVKFERIIGANAYKHIVLLGMYCQQTRSPYVKIEEPIDLEILLDTETNGSGILEALVKTKLVEEVGNHQYCCTFFVDQNAQLMTLWRNGAMRAYKSKQKTNQVDDELDEFMETDYWRNTLSKCAQEEELRHG